LAGLRRAFPGRLVSGQGANRFRPILALKLEPLIRVKAKEQQIRKPESVTQKSAKQKPLETRKELAKAAGVSHDTIAKAKVIEAKASEETKAALRSGAVE